MKKLLFFLIVLLFTATSAWAQTSNYFNGFETTVGVGDWENVVIQTSGTNGIPSSDGSYYADAATDYTRFGGYNIIFPTLGYRTTLDIYLDVDGGFVNDTKFDYSSAINNITDVHRRDFIISGGFYNDGTGPGVPNTNRFIFSASNNSPGWPKDPTRSPIAISTTGWYTFEHFFYNDGTDVLAVDITIYNSSDVLMGTWTLSDLTDIIGTTVGGNRYGWFPSNQFGTLAIDNSSLTVEPLPEPITTIETPTSTVCGSYDIDITVQDFSLVGAISLELTFNHLVLDYQGVTLNPAITSGSFPNIPSPGTFRLGYFGSPATLAYDDVLFTLHFNLLPAPSGGALNFIWSTVPGECEYSGPNGLIVYPGTTFNDFGWSTPVRPVKNIDTGLEYCKIQNAHNDPLTLTGHTLTVKDGVYTEAVAITKGLTIIGDSEAGVIVQAAASQTGSANTFSINAAGLNVTLEKMTIRHGDYGVRSNAGNVNVKNCTIYHNGWDGTGVPVTPTQTAMATFFSTYSTNGGAIRIENSAVSEIAYCTLYENDRGIRFQDGANGLIHDNEVYGNIETGIYLAASTYTGATGCSNTQVYDNQSYDNMEHGLLSIGGIGNSFTNNTNVSGNWNCGMMLWHAADITVEDNTFTGNNIYGFNGVGSSADAKAAIYFDGDVNNAAATFVGKILGNTVSNNLAGSSTQPIAVLVDQPSPAQGITVSGNTFTGHDIDLNVKDQPTTVTANNNNLSGSVYGVLNEVTTGVVDATINWWGHASGPSGVAYGNGVAVSDYVDYCPWLDGLYPGGGITSNVLNTTLGTVHCSIQDAIDNATPAGGDVITVAPGVYDENLNVHTGVILQGANAGIPCYLLRGDESTIVGSVGTAITVNTDGVTIDGFDISNPGGNHAVSASGRNNLSIKNNTIHHIGTLPVLSGNTHAIAIVMGTTANINNVNISENCFSDILGGEDPALTGDDAKSNNGSASAIAVGWSNASFDISNLNIENNFISNVNACTNIWDEGGKGAYGVIINVGASGSYAGKAVSPLVHYNTIFDLEGLWAHGIGLEGETPGAVVNNNEIYDLTDHKTPTDATGILLEDNDGAGTVGLHDNSLTNMGMRIVNLMPGNVDATCNWYGTADPITISTLIYGNMNVNPYLTNGFNNSAPGLPGFIPLPVCDGYFPVHNVTKDLYYITIQAAEDEASPYNFIEAESGIYEEQVHVDVEGLTITGIGLTTPIIKSPAILNASFGTKKAIVCAHTVNSLTLVNFIIDGDGQGNANNSFLGLAFWNSGGTVLDVDVTRVRDNPFSGAQHGVAVYSYNDTDGPYTLKIDGMEVTDFQKNAFALSGDGMTVDLDNIDVDGAGATSVTAQNGIQIGFGAGGTVDASTIDGIAYTGASWTASGILLYQGASVDITDVDISNCQTSVVFEDTDGSFNGGSTITSPTGDGLYIYASGTKSGSTAVKNLLQTSIFDEQDSKGGSKATVNVSIENCEIIGTGAVDSWGVGPYGSGTVTASIINNHITGWDYGIVTYDLGGATINCVANDNNLSNNTSAGFYSNTTNVQNATCNWWGYICGSDIATYVAGSVSFTSWLIGNADLPAAGFQPQDPCTGVFPVLQNATMQANRSSVGGPTWDYLVSGDLNTGFSMCITPDITSFFLDINTLSSSPAMKAGQLNPFTLDQTSLPTSWLSYWAAKGVDGLGPYGDWRDEMWDIINGWAPFFYIKYTTGADYILVDGLKYFLVGGEPILELPGDYPNHIYTYTGNFIDVDNCVSLPIDVTMDFHTCDLSGTLAYNNLAQTGLNNMTITLNSTPAVSATTGTDGSYTLNNVQSGTHTITFNDNGLTAGGINATDAAQANYWGVASWSIEKVRFFAGDVSGENIVSAFDAQQILAYFVNAGTSPYNFTPIWKFWLAGDMISANPYGGPANPSVTVLSTSVTQGLYGLCTGDFNQSFMPGLTKSASESLVLEEGKKIYAPVGTELELPFVAGMDMDLGAVSLILNFPSNKLEVTEVFLSSDPSSPIMYNMKGDELRIGWNSLIPVYLNEGESLITLKVKVIAEAGLEGISMLLVADPMNELADDSFIVIDDAILVMDVIHTSALGIQNNLADNLELANFPNPFNESTTITYSLPTNGKVTLEVYDLLGNKVIVLVEEMKEAGNHQVILNSGILKPGVYMANLKLDSRNDVSCKTIRIISR